MATYLYFGSSQFAATLLGGLCQQLGPPALTITPPARPAKRGKKLAPVPVAALAAERSWNLLETDAVSGDIARERIAEAGATHAAVCAFGQIIREPLLGEYDFLNVHPSLLPRWRGAAPIQRAILAGDKTTGVSIIRLVEALDAGPIAWQAAIDIDPDDTTGSLSERLIKLGLQGLLAVIEGENTSWMPQVGETCYAEKIGKEDRVVDLNDGAQSAHRQIRALAPGPLAWTEIQGMRVNIHQAAICPLSAPKGWLGISQQACPLLGCGEDSLELTRVQPAGKKAMDGASFLRGYPLR